MFRLALISFIILISLGCAKGVDSSPTTTSNPAGNGSSTTKSLFSTWVTSDGFTQIDLRQLAFNQTKTFTVAIIGGQGCSCQGLTQGSQSAGTIAVSSCTGNFSNGSTNCSSFNGTTNYTLSNNTLTFCINSTTTCTSLQ